MEREGCPELTIDHQGSGVQERQLQVILQQARPLHRRSPPRKILSATTAPGLPPSTFPAHSELAMAGTMEIRMLMTVLFGNQLLGQIRRLHIPSERLDVYFMWQQRHSFGLIHRAK